MNPRTLIGVVVAVLVALPLLVGGAALAGVHATQRDGDGFYSTRAEALSTPTHALVANGLDIDTSGAGALFDDGRLGTVRVSATGTAAEPVFVGVARRSQVATYLRGASYDEVTDFEVDPLSVSRRLHPGQAAPAAPESRDFWAARASGAGTQEVTWPAEDGEWAVVVMNADGSAGVRTDVSVGARVGLLLWLGIGFLVAGAFAAIGAAALIRTGTRDALPAAVAQGA